MTRARLVHHELCFGCGRTNLFGLLMELEPRGEGQVRGRGFVKQDHQGAQPGSAHEGIVAAALIEAMAFAAGEGMGGAAFEVHLHAPVPVGAFIEVEARVEERSGDAVRASAIASVDDQPVADATGIYEPV